jgi:hypothetical protein
MQFEASHSIDATEVASAASAQRGTHPTPDAKVLPDLAMHWITQGPKMALSTQVRSSGHHTFDEPHGHGHWLMALMNASWQATLTVALVAAGSVQFAGAV